MTKWQIRVLRAILAACALAIGAADPCLAQADNGIWSMPLNLSDTPQLSTHPAIVTDSYGYVHVFWSEDVGGGPMRDSGVEAIPNSILYTRWDGTGWTPATDVLFVPGETLADFVSVSVDSENRLHVVWTGVTQIYYSSASSVEANSARAWSRPVVVTAESARTRWESDVAVDSEGKVHVVYATRGRAAGVYHVTSQDGAEGEGIAQMISDPFTSAEVAIAGVRLEIDRNDHLHTVWETDESEGYGQAVYYTRSTDAGETWSTPMRLGHRDPDDVWVGWPYLMVDRAPELLLIYIDGSNKGRLQRVSVDGGATWSAPVEIIPNMEGINGYVVPLTDGSEQIHLIINMRPQANQVVGVYYVRWLGNAWSPVTPLDNFSVAARAAHYTAATVRLGNEIFVVYNDIGFGEIWLLRGVLPEVEPWPAAVVPDIRTPSVEPIASAIVMPEATGDPAAEALVTPRVDNPRAAAPPMRSSVMDIVLPSASAAFVVALVLIVHKFARPRRA